MLVKRLIRFILEETRISLGGTNDFTLIPSKLDAVTDFLIKLGTNQVEKAYFLLNI